MAQTPSKNAPAPVPRIDVPNAVRGASTGFSILLIGGLLAPILTIVSSLAAAVWLAGVAVLAFAVAARRSQGAGIPVLHGIFAAVLAYVLVLPLLLPFEQGRDVQQIAQTVLTAVLVGSVTGALSARRVVTNGQSRSASLVRRTGPARSVRL
ncbi:hypothetical protein ACFQ0K_07125 [Nocardioides caeni]|uniref:hypothetical protein n=1 Tax=Nocardioides caeni TaxID=574700 RepID=UPI001874E7F0|nr:hypothetical protein [Nocardioides caeni]